MVLGAIANSLEYMTLVLILHIAAGSLGILSGAVAVTVAKGKRKHRAWGTVFVLSMLTTSLLAVYLAFVVPSTVPGSAPTNAAVSVGILTLYLVATAWMTVRLKGHGAELFEKGAFLVASGVAGALLIFGLHAAGMPAARPGGYVPYFVFASFAALSGALDLSVILRGGISGVARIARHLWRMCFALFFATSFFFLGQQKVMPAFIHGRLLLVPALAPLVLMAFWLLRVRFTNRFRKAVAAA